MKLLAGQRTKLMEAGRALLVKQGRVEAYALMEEGGHRLFLMELEPGEAAFHSADEFGEIIIEVYALEDATLEELSLAEEQAGTLVPLMRHWFKELICLPWLRLLADRGDEILRAWVDGSVLRQAGQQTENLLEEFEENQGIFAMLAGVRFVAQDERLARRLMARRRHKRRLLNETVANLLGEDWVSVSGSGQGSAKLEEAVFLVRAVAHHLGMPEEDIALNKETAEKLDALGVLRRLVAKGGMEMRLIRLEKGWEGWDCGVMLGYFGEKKQLAALLPESPSSYKLVTRENMEGVTLTSEMAESVSGDAFLVYPGLPDRKMRRLDFLRFMARHTWQTDWKAVLLAGLFMGLIPLLTPIVTETMFQDLIPILDRKGLATVTQVVLVAGFTTAALTTVRSLAVLRLTAMGNLRGQAALFGRLLKLPPGFFRRFQSGELAERMQGLDRSVMLLTSESVGALLSFACSFWSLGLMCYYSMKLTGMALLVWLVYLAVSFFLLYRLTRAQRDMTTASNKTSGILAQIFTGLAKFRTKGTEEQAYHLWGQQFAIELGHNIRTRRLKNISTVIAAMQPMLLTLILYYNGLLELATSQSGGGAAAESLGLGAKPMTAATFIAFQSAFTAFNTSLVAIMPILEGMSVIKPYLDNLLPILEEVPETSEERQEAGVLSGAIEVRNLTFGYVPESRVLDDVSFRIAAGEQVAIVGKSGCGKSTLIRLLLGFEMPRQGAVYYDGQDLSELSLPSVRSQMGVVLQNGQLMSGDILHNIIGTNNLTLDDAWEAAEAAGIAEDIRQMPMQMNTIVSEGSTNISGGQRQRILIARALALKPSIIVCDEATSALDNRTQAIVTKSLDKLHATRIIVAHRLSTIRHADRIIVLDKGRIAETGSFQELVEKGGLFASFVKRQVA
ncbi:NHLM bacteriocin system ABC transporter, ATP-binding protein [Selenomonas ruminantium]|uniref:NHLM bacteriocin system ABC transporter, ATP-binding protein n=1 Tax=Selenomonas ruminantium TaxID=971 RepID=A0A1M6RIJ0_SELRU|nr:NHLP bacteriocin export ABC transporter permease/ATPase subunit [Selenomonas ruminantium]SHK32250.1 NHLM bacteriocin system ABC transporter, ATP-binding protein [Selenomonas ruminantium]